MVFPEADNAASLLKREWRLYVGESKGNPVQVRNSTRCCKFREYVRKAYIQSSRISHWSSGSEKARTAGTSQKTCLCDIRAYGIMGYNKTSVVNNNSDYMSRISDTPYCQDGLS